MSARALPTGRAGQALALALLVLGVLVAWFGLIDPAMSWYGARQARLEHDRPVARRMAEIVAELPALRAEAAKRPVSARPDAAVALTGVGDAVAAANLQALVQRLASETGVDFASAERAGGAGATVGFGLSGPYDALIDLLARLDQAADGIVVEGLELQAAQGNDATDRSPLTARLVLSVRPDGAAP